MSKVNLTLAHADFHAEVSMELVAARSDELALNQKGLETQLHVQLSNGTLIPSASIKAAVISGVFYGLGQSRTGEEWPKYAISIYSVHGYLDKTNVFDSIDLCATVATIAILYAIDHAENVAQHLAQGWEVRELFIDDC